MENPIGSQHTLGGCSVQGASGELSAPRVKTGQRGLPCARWRSDRGECPSPAPAPAPSSYVPEAASAGGAPGQGPGLRGARHRAPATRLPGVPGSGHQCVLGAGGPRGAGIRPRLPARQVGAAAELHVPGRPGAGLADPGHHPSVQGRCPPPRQHHQHGALGACGLLLLFRVHSHHHWLWQPEPPHQSGPPLLHPLRSCGDPTPPRGTQPPGAPHAAGRARLRPQDGGRLAGPRQGSLAGGLQRPALGPPAVPAAAAAALLAHGGLELRGGLLLRLHHPQHRGLRRLRDWDEPLQDLSAVVQEHGVLVDPLWAGVAGLDHQTRPLAAGDPKGHMFLLPPWLQGPELEAGPGWRARVLLPTARLLSGEACGPHRVPGSLSSGCRLWQGWLVVHSIISNFLLPNKTPDLGLGT